MTTLRANCLSSIRARLRFDDWWSFVKDAVFDFPVPFSSPTTPTGFPFLSSSNKHFQILFRERKNTEHKKYNVKMFVFFHSRRSRPKKYYGKKPMCPNYYFNIV